MPPKWSQFEPTAITMKLLEAPGEPQKTKLRKRWFRSKKKTPKMSTFCSNVVLFFWAFFCERSWNDLGPSLVGFGRRCTSLLAPFWEHFGCPCEKWKLSSRVDWSIIFDTKDRPKGYFFRTLFRHLSQITPKFIFFQKSYDLGSF